jgi:hypothetical protein
MKLKRQSLWAGGVAQGVECLPSKCEALSSNSSTTHTHKKKKKKERKKTMAPGSGGSHL